MTPRRSISALLAALAFAGAGTTVAACGSEDADRVEQDARDAASQADDATQDERQQAEDAAEQAQQELEEAVE